MAEVEIVPGGGNWRRPADGVLFRGDVFYQGTHVGDDVGPVFGDVSDPSSFRKRVSDLRGEFAIVVDTGDGVHAAVDHLSSIPLYYGRDSETIYVGPSPARLAERLPAESGDPRVAAEFLLTGYVTGTDTLHPGINRLQAGQLLTAERAGGHDLSVEQYYSFTDIEVRHGDRADVFERFDAAALSAFERLAERADGDPIILALSGGYDSRLPALMLDRIAYEDVYAFTFYPDFLTGGDLEIAEEVATALEFEWAPIELTEADFRELSRSEEFTSFERRIEDYSTVKPLPFWGVVLKKLKESPALPDLGTVVVGHNVADSTRHLPGPSSGGREVGVETLVEWLWEHHYTMRHCDRDDVAAAMQERIRERVLPVVRDDANSTRDAAIAWYWQERTPKFLMRHVDEYTYWGYDRAVPLWDRELARFWSSVPPEQKDGKGLYKAFVDDLNERLIGSPCRIAGENDSDGGGSLLPALDTVVTYAPFESQIRRLYRRWQTRNVKRSEDYARYQFLSDEQFEQLYPRVQHEKYFHALEKLTRLDCAPSPESPFAEDIELYEKL